MEKVFIEVRGGMIQNIQTTSQDIEINVIDYDNKDEPIDGETTDSGWQYWRSKGGDQVVTNAEIEKAISATQDELEGIVLIVPKDGLFDTFLTEIHAKGKPIDPELIS